MKYNIVVDINKMTVAQKKMLSAIDEIQDMCKECYRKIDETKEIFDTPTGTYFREKSFELIDAVTDYMKKEVLPFIENIDDIKREYQSLLSEVSVFFDNKKM